jgi:cell wall-associated NlpC family hydrolase
MKAKQIAPVDLKPADLIFLSKKDKPEKITHVMMYSGEGRIIEAPQTGETVHEISLQQRLGKELIDLKNGMDLDGRVVTFGSLLQEIK